MSSIKQLLTIEDILEFRKFTYADNAIDDIDKLIVEAQENELKNFLGQPLYYDLLRNSTLQKYKDLWQGKEYTDITNFLIEFRGLRAVCAYYSLAKIYQSKLIIDTETGFVVKTNPYGTPASNKSIQDVIADLMNVAGTYQNDVIRYLINFNTDFPMWFPINAPENNGGFSIRGAGGDHDYKRPRDFTGFEPPQFNKPT